MAEGSRLRTAVQRLVREELKKIQQISDSPDAEIGTISSVNDDGTVSVDTASGSHQNVGTPVSRVMGQQVTVISADGQKVAV